jgi:hypothetical protein
MPQQEAEQIVAYLRSLANKGAEEALNGDPIAGRDLFFWERAAEAGAICSAIREAVWGPNLKHKGRRAPRSGQFTASHLKSGRISPSRV